MREKGWRIQRNENDDYCNPYERKRLENPREMKTMILVKSQKYLWCDIK